MRNAVLNRMVGKGSREGDTRAEICRKGRSQPSKSQGKHREQMQGPQVGVMLGVFEKRQENQWGWSQMSKPHGELARVQIMGAW